MAERVEKRVRLSVSIPADLARWTRERARRDGTSISFVVETAIRHQMVDEAVRGVVG